MAPDATEKDKVIEETIEVAPGCETLPDGYIFCPEDEDKVDDDEEDVELDETDLKNLEREQMKIWSIVYSKKPELIIDKDEYDRILIDLLQSYADFKQTTIKMDKLQKIEQE